MNLEFEVIDGEKNMMAARLLEAPSEMTPAHLISVAMACVAFSAMSEKGKTVQDILMDMIEMAPNNKVHAWDKVS